LAHDPHALLTAGGITRDGEVIVWHDENFVASKCRDTAPAFEGDEQWPYVGQYVANLTLAQIKTLDCGSLRQADFPLQGVCAASSPLGPEGAGKRQS
jgi:hypothetical protein